MPTLMPRQPVPELHVQTLDHGIYDLSQENPENFNLVVFYRGNHCPVCAKYLPQYDQNLEKFKDLGVSVVAISSNTEELARKSQKDWDLKHLRVGHSLSEDQARHWGLFISKGMDHEPDRFSEPGLFLVRPNGTLYASAVQTMPFARPDVKELLGGIKYINENGYPARGEA